MATIQAIDKMSKSSGLSNAPRILKALKTEDSSPTHKYSSTKEGSGKTENQTQKASV